MIRRPTLEVVLIRHADHGWLADSFVDWADPGERARATAFHRAADRQDYIVSHAALRLVLARASGIAPSRLILRQTETGKPWIDAQGANQPVPAFSLSHSGGHSLIVTTRHGTVGADIEVQHPDIDWPALAPLFLSPAETALFESSASNAAALLKYWVLKEAALKLSGDGLLRDPRTLAIVADVKDRYTLVDASAARPPAHAHLFQWRGGLVGAIAVKKDDAWMLDGIVISPELPRITVAEVEFTEV